MAKGRGGMGCAEPCFGAGLGVGVGQWWLPPAQEELAAQVRREALPKITYEGFIGDSVKKLPEVTVDNMQ